MCLKVVAPQQLFGFLGCLTCISYAGRFTGDLLSQLSYTPIFDSLSDSFRIITVHGGFVKLFLMFFDQLYSFIVFSQKKSQQGSICQCGMGVRSVEYGIDIICVIFDFFRI